MLPPTGHKIVELNHRQEMHHALFAGHSKRGCILQPGAWFLPVEHRKYWQDIKNFEFVENDVVVMTMPKSGTTWTQELVWTMLKNPNLDNPEANQPLSARSPTLGLLSSFLASVREREMGKGDLILQSNPTQDPVKKFLSDLARSAGDSRVIKTHFAFPFISDTALTKAKVVYVIRDPRDVCISYYHHSRIFKFLDFQGTFDQYVDAFTEGVVPFAPYWSHVAQAWDRRHLPNVHIIFYENMKSDPNREIARLNEFLRTDLSEEQMEKIAHYTSFPEMKNRNSFFIIGKNEKIFLNQHLVDTEGGFFRSGTSGSWRKVLTPEQKDKFKAFIEKHCPDMEIMDNILYTR